MSRRCFGRVFAVLFFGAASQPASLLAIEAECRRGSLSKRAGPLSDNTLAYAMQHHKPEDLFALGCLALPLTRK